MRLMIFRCIQFSADNENGRQYIPVYQQNDLLNSEVV